MAHQSHRPQEIPAPLTTRVPLANSLTSSPVARTSPVNSCPRITGGRASSGPWSHSAESVPHSAALLTLMSSSPGPGAAGSGTDSILTSPGARKTAAFMTAPSRGDLDVHLDVARAQRRRLERFRCLVQRIASGHDRGGVDDAAGQEPDRLRPDARRADDATDAQRLRLDQAELGRDLAADVDADVDDPAVVGGQGQRLGHRL